MSDVYEIKQPSELLITINALQSEIKLSKEDAQVILGYMQGHDFMLTLDDGKLMRVDISEENGQRVPYTMDEVIDLVCEWNYEQLEEARAVVDVRNVARARIGQAGGQMPEALAGHEDMKYQDAAHREEGRKR